MKGKRSSTRQVAAAKTVTTRSTRKVSNGNSRSGGKQVTRRTTVQQTTTTTRWWLVGGETCVFCQNAYAAETEYRCSGCDRAVCPDCVAVCSSGECTCPECGTELSTEGA